VAKGHPDHDLPYGYVVSSFVPLAQSLGLIDDDARRILVDNPRELLSVR
jgi:phosphotriesterase-related protein